MQPRETSNRECLQRHFAQNSWGCKSDSSIFQCCLKGKKYENYVKSIFSNPMNHKYTLNYFYHKYNFQGECIYWRNLIFCTSEFTWNQFWWSLGTQKWHFNNFLELQVLILVNFHILLGLKFSTKSKSRASKTVKMEFLWL